MLVRLKGGDNISPYVLKHCTTSLASPITKLFTTCLTQSCLPQEWKMHKICPVPKKGDLSNMSNYQSLLCFLSNVMEVYKIFSFIYPHINKCQFSFYKTNLAYCNYCLPFHLFTIIYIEQKKVCDVLYLNFKRVFDSLSDNELLFKLWCMDITGWSGIGLRNIWKEDLIL